MKWEKVKISEVLFFQEGPGVRNYQFTTDGVKLLNVGNINDGVINLDSTKIYISNTEAFGKYKHFLVDEGDLVIASSGIVVDNFHNKIAYVYKEHLPLCMNTSTIRFKVLDPSRMDLSYFKYFLQTKLFTNQLRKLITGSAQLNFGPSHLKLIDVYLRPLKEQQKICSILDNADNIRQKNKQLISKYDELAQSVFYEMFGDPVRNEKGLEIKNLTGFYINPKEGTKCGPFGSALKKNEYTFSGIPVWTMDNILKTGEFVEQNCLFINEKKYKELEKYDVKNSDIIISRAGTVGKMCIIKTTAKNSVISSNLIRLRLGKDLLPVYFHSLMKYHQDRIIKLKNGAEDAYTHMSTGILDEINFPYPPLELQNRFASIIENIETQKTKTQQALQKSEELFEGLLQGCFKEEMGLREEEELRMAAEPEILYKTKRK